MADVFISYAREDQSTVRRLHEALAARNRESWVDWEGIAPSDEWLTSILEAIDTADAVVCVLSPDWLASAICRREAEHAIAAHKRLVPVVAREAPEGADVPAAIADLNWIFARTESEIDGAADQIVDALDTDPDAIRVHTLVHTRSRAWELAGKRRTTLLRGDELRRAEAWVSRAAAGTKPQPTELQAAFVSASRAATRSRTRLAFASVIGVAVLSAALAAFALVSRSQAIHQTRVAVSQELTAESAATLSTDPELSLLLAQQALDHNNNPAGRLAFVTAFDQTSVRSILRWGGPSGVNSIAWSPKASLVAVAGADGSIALWNPIAGTLVRRLSANRSGVGAVAFSPNGRLLASGGNDDLVHLWNVGDGRLLRTCSGHTGPVNSLAFSAGSEGVVSGSDDGTARIWQVSNCREAGVLQDGGHVNGVAVAPGDRFIATVDITTGYTKLWGLGSNGWVVGRAFRTPDALPVQVAISPNGKLVATTSEDGKLRLWNWQTEQQPKVFATTSRVLIGVAFSPDGTLLAAGGDDTVARIWDVESHTLIETLKGNRGLVSGVSFSPDGRSLVTSGGDETARRYVVRGSIGALEDAVAGSGQLVSATVSPTGDLVVASTFGAADAWSLTGKQLWHLALPPEDAFSSTAFDARGDILAGELTRGIDIVRASDGTLERSIRTPHSLGLALSRNGELVAVAGRQGIVRVYRVSTGQLVYARPLGLGYLFALAFSPDGTRLAVSTVDNEVVLLDAATGRQTARLRGPTAPVYALAFSPDGTLLAGGSADKRTWLWSSATGKALRTFQGHTDAVDSVAISPDGDLLVSGSDDRTARIWNLQTGDEMRVLSGDVADVTSVGFTPDGDSVITSSIDGTLRFWDSCAWCLSVAGLNAHAKPALARCLTPDELAKYLQEAHAKRQPCAA